MKKLLIVTTGGTIDKIYFDDMSDYKIGEQLIGQILDNMKVGFEFVGCEACASCGPRRSTMRPACRRRASNDFS